MAEKQKLQIAVHDNSGVHVVEGYPSYGAPTRDFSKVGKAKNCCISKEGSKIAIIANGSVTVLQCHDGRQIGSTQHPTAQDFVFSPCGRFLAVWCLYVKAKEGSSGQPNLHVYDVKEEMKFLKSFFQISQSDWQPQWTACGSIFARNVTNEVHFYKADSLETMVHKRVQPKLQCFSLSPSKSNHAVAFFTPALKGAPCLVNILKYPHFKENSQAIASKSFYKVDTIDFLWNKPCNALLLMASEDKGSSTSYYGEKMVFLMNIKNGEAVRVTFDRSGPVHSVDWSPDGKAFLAVFGSNPAVCAMFNTKGDQVKSFSDGARNTVMVNPVSNLAFIGGFGNISPRIEVWEVGKGTKISYQECPDMTYIEWSPCGQYLLTATCSPRLRVNNGYRIYHYSGSLLYEHLCPSGTELYSARWVPCPSAAKPFSPSSTKVEGITSAVKVASTQRYIPPGQRNANNSMVENCKQFLSQIDKYDPRTVADAKDNNKKTEKKKKKDEKKAKEEAEQKAKNMLVIEEPEGFVKKGKSKGGEEKSGQPFTEEQKKAKFIQKKLQRIEKLRQDKKEGKTLEKQQLELLNSERSLLAELKALNL